MTRQNFRFFHRLRVRWAEVDMQKIVFNAHYLMYFDTAITDYWRALALPYEEALHQLGGDLYLKKASVEYHASARFDDQLDIALKSTRIGQSSLLFAGAIFCGDQLLVTCELIYVFADPSTQKSKPVPEALRQILSAYEAGEAMVRTKTGWWAELGADASGVRSEVFVVEQQIAPEIESDQADQTALHAVRYNGLGQPIATGRLLVAQNGVAKIGRMAVKRVLRGTGQGKAILQALLAAARARGDCEVMLHAQCSAAGFYTAQGFSTRGAPFDEAGLQHIEMFRVS